MKKDSKFKNIKLFSLSASKQAGEAIAKELNLELAPILINWFQDKEILIRSLNSIRNKDVYVIQSTCPPVNDNLMELLIAIDSFKRAWAKSINVIIPYFGYSRQDRTTNFREPITCKLVSNLLKTAGANKIILFDLHSPQTMGFFDIPVDSLKPVDEFAHWIFEFLKANPDEKQICFVAPDRGALIKTTEIANKFKLFNSQIALIEKQRTAFNKSEIKFVLGDVKDKVCFLIDDMIDTGGTILNACDVLKNKKAKKIIVLATHGLFSNNALNRFAKSVENKIIDRIVVTDTIFQKNKPDFLTVISINKFLANVIKKIIFHESVSKLYENRGVELNKLIIEYLKTKNNNEN